MNDERGKKRDEEINADVKEVRHAIRAMHRMGLRFVSGSIHRTRPDERPPKEKHAVDG